MEDKHLSAFLENFRLGEQGSGKSDRGSQPTWLLWALSHREEAASRRLICAAGESISVTERHGVEEKRVTEWEPRGTRDMPAHQAVGSVAKGLANAQRCPESDQTSDIRAGDLQGGNQNNVGVFL